MTKLDWEINIMNLVESVERKLGTESAKTLFLRFDATCFEDLNPAFYSEVFSDLMLMDSDSD